MLISQTAAKIIADEARKDSRRIVFTNGCFDIIHAGHVKYLAEAKKLGDVLFLGLNSDQSVRRLKGDSRPINSETDRASVLSALRFIDYVVVFGEDTPENIIRTIRPDVLVKGGDYKIENIVGADFVKSEGGEVVTIDFVDGKSTTKIIEKMKSSK
ncbi:MAG: D-glycero-beta-D-manno-heptose 1-phosphate adenylyltransferase [Candidatus Kapabacteria bacterium]|nr:D-glycero-beta-D-manno-heptose 1-phosphate adenylyltransferase [Candidatus Kapabacteria bacterium]